MKSTNPTDRFHAVYDWLSFEPLRNMHGFHLIESVYVCIQSMSVPVFIYIVVFLSFGYLASFPSLFPELSRCQVKQ